jgi:hypothetical protein
MSASEGTETQDETFELRLSLDRCKFFPRKPIGILAGSVIETESDLLKPSERCLVNIKTGVQSMVKRWANDLATKKCTGWLKLVVPVSVKCKINRTKTIEKSRNLGANLLTGEVIEISDPLTFDLKLHLDQVKFYPTKLAVLDGLVIEADKDFNNNNNNMLAKGEKCWVHLRSHVVSLMNTLRGPAESHARNKKATGWMKFIESIPVTCRILYSPTVIERNRKGALMLECLEIVDIQLPESGEPKYMKLGERSFQSNSELPMLQDRSERHKIFAEWLVEKFGTEFLSSGSGVLDVAGGKGELSHALYDLGVTKSIVLDPDPRCTSNVPYQIIKEPLGGDGSELTNRHDEVGKLVRSCSIIAGMHPDQATEAIVDTSLRLGVPFAILPW